MVSSPLMCSACFHLADSVDDLKRYECPRFKAEVESPKPVPAVEPAEKALKGAAVTPQGSSGGGPKPSGGVRKASMLTEMQRIDMEIKRLQLLKEIAIERESLATLMSQKQQSSSA